ncbi:hypothetical protein BH09BAC1_BH09BAC1_23750 [soil metagenome]
MRYYLLLVVLMVAALNLWAQPNDKNTNETDIPKALENVRVERTKIVFSNPDYDIANGGGHLQGVQYYSNGTTEYVIVSGSSDSVSYYAMVDIKAQKVVRYKELLRTPFDHAGGFQVIGDFLVIGVEDNLDKNSSKVLFLDISRPGESDNAPLITIDRGGEFKTKTAGAVAITHFDTQHLLAVATWDASTIDFYWSNAKPLNDPACKFELIQTWTPTKGEKENWIDKWWRSYQSINLFTGADGKMYMFAFFKSKDGNFTDLFEVSFSSETKKFTLVKVASKQFYVADGNNFRNGGGVRLVGADELHVYSIPHNIKKKKTVIDWYQRKK